MRLCMNCLGLSDFMALKTNVDEWLKSGEYLPEPLRDFHDQKEVFKAMHEIILERPGDTIKRPTWIEGQCYVIDVFLWFMARRGWTLQRTRRDGDFRNLADDVRAQTERRDAESTAMLRSMLTQPAPVAQAALAAPAEASPSAARK